MQNVGGVDRVLRVIIGLLGIGVALFFYLDPAMALPAIFLSLMPQMTWIMVFGIVGVVLLFTGVVGFCALYVPFGWSSCAKPKQ